MASEVQTGCDNATVTGLVTGIIHDAEELFKQEVALLKAEMREDFRKTKDSVIALSAGAAVAAVGGLLLCWMLVYILNEVVGVPLWGSFGIVGGTFAVLGAILLYAGVKKLESFNPLPDQTAESLKENVQWITKPK
jgi:hypothetical protein